MRRVTQTEAVGRFLKRKAWWLEVPLALRGLRFLKKVTLSVLDIVAATGVEPWADR